MDDQNRKQCTRCRDFKHRIDDFHRDNHAADGRAMICKDCKREARRKRLSLTDRSPDASVRRFIRDGCEFDVSEQAISLKSYCEEISGPSAMQKAQESIHILKQAVANIERAVSVWEQNQEETDG